MPHLKEMASTDAQKQNRRIDLDGAGLCLPDLEGLAEAVAARALELLEHRAASEVERWIGAGDAAAYLACPRSRIYALVSAERIPHRKDGSRLLFRCSELDAWVASGGGRRP